MFKTLVLLVASTQAISHAPISGVRFVQTSDLLEANVYVNAEGILVQNTEAAVPENCTWECTDAPKKPAEEYNTPVNRL